MRAIRLRFSWTQRNLAQLLSVGHVMASLAQMERELIIEQPRAGLEAAQRMVRVGGRKRLMTESKVESARQLLAGGPSPGEVGKNLGVSVPTLYRWIPASARE